MEFAVIALQAVICLFIADFLSGFFHWFEDGYGNVDTPIYGRIVVQPNVLHHYDAAHFTQHPWLVSARGPMLLAAIGIGVAYLTGVLHWTVVLVALLGANANEFHKWSHQSRSENGKVITLLQDIGILQPPAHHAVHHRGQKNTSYCTITCWLDPVLDRTHFWRGLEWAAYGVTRVQRRDDPSLSPVVTDTPRCTMPSCQRIAAERAALVGQR